MLKHKDEVKVGDAIKLPDGKYHTVCEKDIRYEQIMGTTIFGNSFKLGYELVDVLDHPTKR